MSDRRGLLIILSSPSGAGKSTLARRLTAWDPTIIFSVSATTRAPRQGEVDGQDYFFRSLSEFRKMVDSGEMLEHAEVFGNHYGSPLGPVERSLAMGRDVLFDIDWQGTLQIQQSSLARDALTVFVLPPSIKELENRLKTRAKDSDDVVKRRMDMAWGEISHWEEYQYVLVNSDIHNCEDELKKIVSAERLKRHRQPQLDEFVKTLNTEFEARE